MKTTKPQTNKKQTQKRTKTQPKNNKNTTQTNKQTKTQTKPNQKIHRSLKLQGKGLKDLRSGFGMLWVKGTEKML